MDISVTGAGGAIGREIVAQIVEGRVLKPTERLQLAGKRGGASERVPYALRSDLTDAYAENAPQMDIALSPEEVVGDVVVMAAGTTPGPDAGPAARAAPDSGDSALSVLAEGRALPAMDATVIMA